jgi:ribosomal protein S12 methylthiotransferase
MSEKNLYLVSLGCAKNLVDSEIMLAILLRDGYRLVSEPDGADLLLINTCGFIHPAVAEAVDEILRLAEYKKKDPGKKLVVTGCLVQRYGRELAAELPEVDLFAGTSEMARMDELIGELGPSPASTPIHMISPPTYLMDAGTPRLLSTPPYMAYLKITEGCDNRCSYCLIPSIRGPLRSRTIDDLLSEAGRLEASGVRELNLIAQDLTAYGDDLAGGDNLVRLLEQLVRRTTIPWLRLLYLYPTTTGEALLSLMASEPRIVPYLDIPFQHVSDRVLKRMNRRYGFRDLERLLEMINRYLPHCAIRTTLLVGFPGETERDVDELIDFLEQWQLAHVGVFQYQDEEECTAHRLDGKVSAAEKEDRYRRVMEAQAAISRRNSQQFVGRVEPVLVEGVSAETDLLLAGRTRYQAPEIDGCVYINEGKAGPGEIVDVQITEAHVYDLVGQITER